MQYGKFILSLTILSFMVGSTGCGSSGSSGNPSNGNNATGNHITASASKLPDTGQSKCFNEEEGIPCPDASQPYFSQDGNYTTNELKYADNKDGTITDMVTGLTWQGNIDSQGYSWSSAATYCSNLELAGFKDWRLPSRHELFSIINFSMTGPAYDMSYFKGNAGRMWTVNESPYGSAWYVSGGDGESTYRYQGITDNLTVRCVRGNAWLNNNFIDNGNGTITDETSGLVWQKEDDGQTRSWSQALSYCSSLELGGLSGWRLPDIKELESISDLGRMSPSLNNSYFSKVSNSYYLSSTTYESIYSASYVWMLNFKDGSIDTGYTPNGNKDSRYHYYVRCVH